LAGRLSPASVILSGATDLYRLLVGIMKFGLFFRARSAFLRYDLSRAAQRVEIEPHGRKEKDNGIRRINYGRLTGSDSTNDLAGAVELATPMFFSQSATHKYLRVGRFAGVPQNGISPVVAEELVV